MEGPLPSVQDTLQAQMGPEQRLAVERAPTLMQFSQQPQSPQAFLNVLKLIGEVLAERTSPTPKSLGGQPVSEGIMPGLPNPGNLPLTKVLKGDKPTRVYRGTPTAYAKEDPGKWDPNGLYGPGAYFTENPKVASGYSAKPPTSYEEMRMASPNIRPAYLDITKPLDMDQPARKDWLQQVLSRYTEKYPNNDGSLAAHVNEIVSLKMTNEFAYDSFVRHGLPKKLLNEAAQAAGYDGITHIGGARTGGEAHRVWIAFKPRQEVNPFQHDVAVRDYAKAQQQRLHKD